MKLSKIKQKYKDSLNGGKGDNVDLNKVNQKELAIGILVELEHTDDIIIACEIAGDHLSEVPNYYSKLIKSGLVDEQPAIELYKKLF